MSDQECTNGFYSIENLGKLYSADSAEPALAIDNLFIPLGGIIAVVGESGSGKTTLLNLLSGLEPPDRLRGKSPEDTPRLDLRLPSESKIRCLAGVSWLPQIGQKFPFHKVSYIFQQGYLLKHASLAINLAMTRRAAGYPADLHALEELLEIAQLGDIKKSIEVDNNLAAKQLSDRAITLSGGQQQCVNIARALGRNPEIIFADELSSSLDPEKARSVMDQLKQWVWSDSESHHNLGLANGIRRTNLRRSMLWVTHDYSLACEYADAVVVLNQGKLAINCNCPIELGVVGDSEYADINEGQLREWVHSGSVPVQLAQVSQSANNVSDLANNVSDPENNVSDPENNVSGPENTPAIAIEPDHPPSKTASKSSIANKSANNKNADRKLKHKFGCIAGNLGDGISLSIMEAYRNSPETCKGSVRKGLSYLWQILFGFAYWTNAVQLAAILALVTIIVYGQKAVIQYFDDQLSDPALSHVIVNQSLREIRRSKIDDESLGILSKKINDMTVNPLGAASKEQERAAFGRHTEYVNIHPPGRDNANAGYDSEATIGILDSKEPVYRRQPVFPLIADKPGCHRDDSVFASDLIANSAEMSLIVSYDYIEAVQKMFDVDLCQQPIVELHDKGNPRTFRVVGFMDKVPADGDTYFDAVMQMGVWRTWLSLIDRKARPFYERASVYFTQKNHASVISLLYENAFAFDRDIISKFEKLLSMSSRLRNTFLGITWLTLAVAVTVASGLIWNYLVQNSKSIAVLRAHDAWLWPLITAIPFQLLLTFCYAVAYLLAGSALWNLIVGSDLVEYWFFSLSGGTWNPGPVTLDLFKPALPWIIASLLVMFLVGWLCLLLWRISHRNIAEELRQAY